MFFFSWHNFSSLFALFGLLFVSRKVQSNIIFLQQLIPLCPLNPCWRPHSLSWTSHICRLLLSHRFWMTPLAMTTTVVWVKCLQYPRFHWTRHPLTHQYSPAKLRKAPLMPWLYLLKQRWGLFTHLFSGCIFNAGWTDVLIDKNTNEWLSCCKLTHLLSILTENTSVRQRLKACTISCFR